MQENTARDGTTGASIDVTADAKKDAIKNAATEPRAARVLLADTGALLCQQVTAMLSAMMPAPGCEVIHAADGFEVLCRLPELRPDVLVLAADLPRLSGIQVCTLLRQSPDFATLPVLMLIGEHAVVDQVRADMAGADACLEKPFRSEELRQAFIKLQQSRCARASSEITQDTQESVGYGLPAHSG